MLIPTLASFYISEYNKTLRMTKLTRQHSK